MAANGFLPLSCPTCQIMKNLIFFFTISLALISCNNSADEEQQNHEDSIEANQVQYGWQASLNDSTGQLQVLKQEMSGPDSLEPRAVVSFLNRNNPDIVLSYVKTSGDTVYTRIPDAMYLTQQMGSTGPMIYLATVVYNLTEIPGIHFVNVDFEEGDHAQPGTFNRESFKGE